MICPPDKQEQLIVYINQFFEVNGFKTVKVDGSMYKEINKFESQIIIPSVLIIDNIFDENSVSYSNLHDIISSNCFKFRNNLACIYIS